MSDSNLFASAIAVTIVMTLLRNPPLPRRIPFDGIGVALLTLGVGSFQYVLDGPAQCWFDDTRVLIFAVTALIGIVVYRVELWGTRPIFDLRIFRYANVRVGTIFVVLLRPGKNAVSPTAIAAECGRRR